MIPKKILSRLGKTFYWKGEGDLHTTYGMLKDADLKKSSGRIQSNIEKEFLIMNASFVDKMQCITRGPQAMMEKDIAILLAYTSPEQDAKIVEVGAGSGKLSCFLGHFFPKATIISYDRNESHLNLAKKNTAELGITNIEFRLQDVLESFSEKDVDVVFMDIPDPDKAAKNVAPVIKNGGYFVVYVPTIVQVQSFVEEAKRNDLLVERVIEVNEREWHVEDLKVRPVSSGIMHTAFLVFTRKI